MSILNRIPGETQLERIPEGMTEDEVFERWRVFKEEALTLFPTDKGYEYGGVGEGHELIIRFPDRRYAAHHGVIRDVLMPVEMIRDLLAFHKKP